MSTCYIDIHPIGMHKQGERCADLIEMTAGALSEDVVAVILLAIQRNNLELGIKLAIKWYVLMHSRIRMR